VECVWRIDKVRCCSCYWLLISPGQAELNRACEGYISLSPQIVRSLWAAGMSSRGSTDICLINLGQTRIDRAVWSLKLMVHLVSEVDQ
jgi:hypothetical protein